MFFNLCGHVFMLATITIFQMAVILVDYKHSYEGKACLQVVLCIEPIVLCLIMLALLRLLSGRLAKLLQGVAANGAEAEAEMLSLISEAADKRSMITTYRRGPAVAEQYLGLHKKLNGSNFGQNKFRMDAFALAELVPTIIVVLVILLLGGTSGPAGTLSTGQFVALFKTTLKFGKAVVAIFQAIFIMMESYRHVVEVAALLNAPTRRHNIYHGQQRRQRLVAEYEKDNGIVPDLTIKVHELGFQYPAPSACHLGNGNSKAEPCKVLQSINVDFEPGMVIAVVGDGTGHETNTTVGKTTFLRLLARQMVPTTHRPCRQYQYVVPFALTLN